MSHVNHETKLLCVSHVAKLLYASQLVTQG
jgi:hypothetical protein